MNTKSLPQRERLLSIWAKDRLADRETVQWAVIALKEVGGSLGKDTASLFEFLDNTASANPALSADVKKVWRLLRIAAHERETFRTNPFAVLEIKEKIVGGTIRPDDLHLLSECIRPRLAAEELSPRANGDDVDSREDKPLRWVRW